MENQEIKPKTNTIIILALVISILLSVVAICGIIYVSQENNNQWEKQKKYDSLNVELWEKQMEINQNVVDIFNLLE